MLARYQIIRGKRPPNQPLPEGVRLDTRKHTKSPFRPDAEDVETLLASGADERAFERFRRRYLQRLAERLAEEPEAFEAIAERARREDVFLGCNCPTRRNPDVRHCHTMLALQFMAERFPDVRVRMP